MSKREFLFQDGKSDKFWNIEVNGSDYEVNYGRAGTTGQTQTKSFDSVAAAQAAADKLIAEKVKKGYLESGASNAGSAAPAPKVVVPAKTAAKVEKAAVEEVTPEVAPAPQAPVSVPISDAVPERVLNLKDTDWLWATWRPRVQQMAPKIKPFDKAACLEKAKRVMNGSYFWDWHKAYLKPPFSKEEAHFWMTAILLMQTSYGNNPNKAQIIAGLLQTLDAGEYDGTVSRNDILENLTRTYIHGELHFPALLFALFSPQEALELIFDIDMAVMVKNSSGSHLIGDCAVVFRKIVLPYLTEDEVGELREFVLSRQDKDYKPAQAKDVMPRVFPIAAALGMPDFVEPLVESWTEVYKPDDAYYIDRQGPQEVIFGLANARDVTNHMRRLELPLSEPDYITAWLAHTEFAELDYITHSIINASNVGMSYGTSTKDVADSLVKAFSVVEAPEAAPHMLRIMLESKAPRPAREWLDEHPLHAIHGLLPIAFGRGKLAEAAFDYLKTLRKRGFEEHLRAASIHLSEHEQARLEAEIFNANEKQYEPFTDETAPEAVRAALAGDKKLSRQRTGWIGAADLPPIIYGESRLSDSQVEALLSALRKEDHPLALAVKSTANAASLDEFAWQLFQRWLNEGAPSKEKWAMLAIGQLGGDKSAVKLAPLVRAWPGESQHQRAVTGLECLWKIGTDTALMQLNGIAQKVKFKGLQTKAQEYMEAIANDKGLSRSQLEDRVVPDCGLDERGSRVFDFGPRQFRFILGPDMKPMVREENTKHAKPKPNLPAPNSKDDASKAEEALADWKLLKKQLSELTKIQTVRLEQAMVKGRRWTLEEFETLLARHPLMINFVRLLVWEVAAGNRRATFRVTEDGTYADCNDETFDLAGGGWAHVGIAHPLNIPDDEKRAWGEIFSDYEIVPPFVQLSRPIYGLEEDEVKTQIITRFKDQKVQPQTLCFTLEKLDWERGPALDGGGFYEHYKYFENSDVTACVVYGPGLFMGGQEYWDPQQVEEIYFVSGLRSKRTSGYWEYPDKKKAVLLGELDAVALSEVLKDVTEIVAKGEVK